jgi:hypothetical protein
MAADLEDQIRTFVERGVRHVSAAEAADLARAGRKPVRAERARPRLGPGRWTAIGAGAAAVVCSVTLVTAANAGGAGRSATAGQHRAGATVLTAAFVRHIASVSRLALAHSGRVVVHSRQLLGGVLQQAGRAGITFSGGNWNDAFSEELPASGGQPAIKQSAINRVVGGQAYDYFVAADGLAWYHDTGPDAVSSMAIPDPRLLLEELAPGARFVLVGHATIGGVRLTHLRATVLSGLPASPFAGLGLAGKLASLDVWVDSHGVVHQMSMTGTESVAVTTFSPKHPGQRVKLTGPASHDVRLVTTRDLIAAGRSKMWILARNGRPSTTVQLQVSSLVVTFSGIGQPQVIPVPAHAIPTYGLG